MSSLRSIQISAYSANNVLSIVQRRDADISVSDICQDKNGATNKNKNINLEQKQSKKTSDYLKIKTIQKMICQFLTEKKMPKEKLAEVLGITVKELLQLSSSKTSPALIHKINLPLVKLYCATKFNTSNKVKKS